MCPLPFRSRRCAKSPGGSGPTGDSRFHAAEPGLQLQGHLQKAVPTSRHEKVTHLFFNVSHISENRGPLGYCAPRPPESAGGGLTGAGRTGSAEPRAVGRRENRVLGPPARAALCWPGAPALPASLNPSSLKHDFSTDLLLLPLYDGNAVVRRDCEFPRPCKLQADPHGECGSHSRAGFQQYVRDTVGEKISTGHPHDLMKQQSINN